MVGKIVLRVLLRYKESNRLKTVDKLIADSELPNVRYVIQSKSRHFGEHDNECLDDFPKDEGFTEMQRQLLFGQRIHLGR